MLFTGIVGWKLWCYVIRSSGELSWSKQLPHSGVPQFRHRYCWQKGANAAVHSYNTLSLQTATGGDNLLKRSGQRFQKHQCQNWVTLFLEYRLVLRISMTSILLWQDLSTFTLGLRMEMRSRMSSCWSSVTRSVLFRITTLENSTWATIPAF